MSARVTLRNLRHALDEKVRHLGRRVSHFLDRLRLAESVEEFQKMRFSCKMCRLKKESAVLEGKIFKNSLLNSLLAGNLVRERLAPDCLLRQSILSGSRDRDRRRLDSMRILGGR